MALFSILIVLLLERTLHLSQRWQFEYWFNKFSQKMASVFEPSALVFQLLVLIIPALLTYALVTLASGLLFGVVSLLLWVLIPLLCVGCLHYRELYKKYLLSVCHQDVQGSYHVGAELADLPELAIEDQAMLGAKVGRLLTWINYRFYCSIVLLMMIGGPVAVVFYASVRQVEILSSRHLLPRIPLIEKLLFLLDWIPARIVALGYVLVGNFSHAIPIWLRLVLQPKISAYDLVTNVAMAAEQISHTSPVSGVCMKSTVGLVDLAKRNLMLLLAAISLSTIFRVFI